MKIKEKEVPVSMKELKTLELDTEKGTLKVNGCDYSDVDFFALTFDHGMFGLSFRSEYFVNGKKLARFSRYGKSAKIREKLKPSFKPFLNLFSIKTIASESSVNECLRYSFTYPLFDNSAKAECMSSGLRIDCGEKMRLGWNNTTNCSKKKPRKYVRHNFNCGRYNRHGKIACNSHYIKMKDMNAIVLTDIRAMAALVVEDEEAARQKFLAHKEKQNAHQTELEKKRLHEGRYRLAELEKLIPSIYEDKVLGKIPEDVCVNLLEKYQEEQKTLSAEVDMLEAKLSAVKQDERDVEEFIRRLKKYTNVQELTREMALELIEYITVDEYNADRPRDIHIYYKLLEKPLPHKKYLDVEQNEETA